jgi:NAD-dependent DNA ligase
MASESESERNTRIARRQKLDELIGLARGLTADGVLNQSEVEYLEKWLVAHSQVVRASPVTQTLHRRVAEMLSDGVVDPQERAELFDTLSRFSGNDFELGEVFPSTSLPFCDPVPLITFPGQAFCLTGIFKRGGRSACEAEIRERGGTIHVALTQKTNYLVVGAYASQDWKHSSFGTKILKAIEYRDRNIGTKIIGEDAWSKALERRASEVDG